MHNPLHIYSALISLKTGLANMPTPQLRAVSIDFDHVTNQFIIFFFYDGEIAEKDLELAYLADTDTDCLGYLNSCRIIRLDFPEPLPIKGKFAYLRKEPQLPAFQKENHAFLLKELPPLAVLVLSMQQALLGKITPSLRHVYVGIDANKKQLEAGLTYHGAISEEDENLANIAAKEACLPFPDYKMEVSIKRSDFPNNIHDVHPHSSSEKMGVYWRYERDW